jgi:L-histidine N-alpha-methyltransferase
LEFGAGDGSKTKILLRWLLEKGARFTYYPVDISQHILNELTQSLLEEMPTLKVHPLNLEYFDAIKEIASLNHRRNITLFLGSNMGNFTYRQAVDFYQGFARKSKSGDLLLIGIDRRKDPHVIRQAYDDPHGITAAFNLNLLQRMNRELGAGFAIDNFSHYTFYEPVSGEVRSYLVSHKNQQVYFEALDTHFSFKRNELIHTEISKKYDPEEIGRLAHNTGYTVLRHFTDSRQYFLNSLWEIR